MDIVSKWLVYFVVILRQSTIVSRAQESIRNDNYNYTYAFHNGSDCDKSRQVVRKKEKLFPNARARLTIIFYNRNGGDL